MRELYIYYRVRLDAAAAALPAAQAMQARLRAQHPGLAARLLRRPNDPGRPPTWMEIYTYQRDGAPPGVTRAMEADIAVAAASALATFVDGERHTEVFVPCAS